MADSTTTEGATEAAAGADRAATIERTVRAYLAAVAGDDVDAVTTLYAADATVEDPVGSEPKVGLDAIREFYSHVVSLETATELLTLRVAGDSAAFHFRVTSKFGEQTFVVEPIDVMTFDAAGAITSMRAYWAQNDMRAV